LIEDAYRLGEATGLAVWCADQAGPYQTIPYPGQSCRPEGDPARLPHEYLREGTAKALTLFHPADGRVRLDGLTACPNAVLHPWLKRELAEILAAMPAPAPETAGGWRPAWERWQEGLSIKPTLPEEPPPLRMLLVLDNLAGYKTPELVCWLFDHGIMPLYTPVGGSWLNMAESPPRILKRRAAPGRHRPDHRLVRGGGPALEHRPDPLRVGRQEVGATASATRASSPPRRLGGMLSHSRPPMGQGRLWPRPSHTTH
jgi:hypothetical protein